GSAREIRVELVPGQHAAAVFVDQLADRDAGGRDMNAGLGHAPGNGEGAQAFALAPALTGETRRAFLPDVADPGHGLPVVLERRPAEEPDLCHVRRPEPGHAALAFDRFDHRRFFAADVCACAAAQLDLRQATGRLALEAFQLLREDRAAGGVLVAQIHID